MFDTARRSRVHDDSGTKPAFEGPLRRHERRHKGVSLDKVERVGIWPNNRVESVYCDTLAFPFFALRLWRTDDSDARHAGYPTPL